MNIIEKTKSNYYLKTYFKMFNVIRREIEKKPEEEK